MLQFYRRMSGENHLGVGLGAGPGCRSMSVCTNKLRRTSSIDDSSSLSTSGSETLQTPTLTPVNRVRANTCISIGDKGTKPKYGSEGNLLKNSANSLPESWSGFAGSPISTGREGFVCVGERERESELMMFSSPRLFQRRGGVVGDIDVSSIQKQVDEGAIRVLVEEEKGGRQVTDAIPLDKKKPLREALDFIFIKHDLEVDWEPQTHYFSLVSRNGVKTVPDLDLPITSFSGTLLEVRPLQKEEVGEEEEKQEKREKQQEVPVFTTLQSCLNFFSTHGLVELPLPHPQEEEMGEGDEEEEEEEYNLPSATPIDNIPGSWEELPIKEEFKESLTAKQTNQQRTIWELISTEHSHIKQLGIIINLFMRCLELVKRANVLSRDNYHNVFGGYMEELHRVHCEFWYSTLWPCLEQVYVTGKPLDLSIITENFPDFDTHFEIYEQHCALDAVNLRNLDKAMVNRDFRTYLEWCEAHPVCQRRKLKDFLVIPMQRLTKYPILFKAILKETTDPNSKQQLDQIWYEVDSFVQAVNTVLVAQTETERVRDAMSRIVIYSAVDIPGEFKEVMQPYTHLDLLTPMPDVEIDQPRVLMLEGNLKFRDSSTSKMVAHIFLFTDMILITRAKKGGEKFIIERPPYQISSLVLHPQEPGSFLVLVLSQYRVLTSWFTLKASTDAVATEWMQAIIHAQECYTEAVEKKVHHWKIIQSLKNERILNGLENRGTQWGRGSRPSLSPPSKRSTNNSIESLDHSHFGRLHPQSLELRPFKLVPMSRSRSAETKKFHSNPALNQIRLFDSQTGSPPNSSQWLERTSSLKTLIERPESSEFGSPSGSTNQLLSPHHRSYSMDQTISPNDSPDLTNMSSDDSEEDIQQTANDIPRLDSPLPIATTVNRNPTSPQMRRVKKFNSNVRSHSQDDKYMMDLHAIHEQVANGYHGNNEILVTPPSPKIPAPKRRHSLASESRELIRTPLSLVIAQQKRRGSSGAAIVAKETGSTHSGKHPHLPTLAGLKNAIQNRRNIHKQEKQEKQLSNFTKGRHANSASNPAHMELGMGVVGMLGCATLAMFCSPEQGTRDGEKEEEEGENKVEEDKSSVEREVEKIEGGVGDKMKESFERKQQEEVETLHTVIPTSESDTESPSSSPRTHTVECINDINLKRNTSRTQAEPHTHRNQNSNSNPESQTTDSIKTKNDQLQSNTNQTVPKSDHSGTVTKNQPLSKSDQKGPGFPNTPKSDQTGLKNDHSGTTNKKSVVEKVVHCSPPTILVSQVSMPSNASSDRNDKTLTKRDLDTVTSEEPSGENDTEREHTASSGDISTTKKGEEDKVAKKEEGKTAGKGEAETGRKTTKMTKKELNMTRKGVAKKEAGTEEGKTTRKMKSIKDGSREERNSLKQLKEASPNSPHQHVTSNRTKNTATSSHTLANPSSKTTTKATPSFSSPSFPSSTVPNTTQEPVTQHSTASKVSSTKLSPDKKPSTKHSPDKKSSTKLSPGKKSSTKLPLNKEQSTVRQMTKKQVSWKDDSHYTTAVSGTTITIKKKRESPSSTRRGVRELSMLFESETTDRPPLPGLHFPKSQSMTTGLNLGANNLHDDHGKRWSLENCVRKSVSTSKLNRVGESEDEGEEEEIKESVTVAKAMFGGREKAASLDDLLNPSVTLSSPGSSFSSSKSSSSSSSAFSGPVNSSSLSSIDTTQPLSSLPVNLTIPSSSSSSIAVRSSSFPSSGPSHSSSTPIRSPSAISPSSSSSFSSATTSIKNNIGQIHTKTNNYHLPVGKMGGKRPRVNPGLVRRRFDQVSAEQLQNQPTLSLFQNDPVPIPFQNGASPKSPSLVVDDKVQQNNRLGHSTQAEPQNNHVEPKYDQNEPPSDQERPKGARLHHVKSDRLPKVQYIDHQLQNDSTGQLSTTPNKPEPLLTIPNQTRPLQATLNHTRPLQTIVNQTRPNKDETLPMVRALAAKFDITATPPRTAETHIKPRPRPLDHAPNNRIKTDGFEFMGVKILNGVRREGERRLEEEEEQEMKGERRKEEKANERENEARRGEEGVKNDGERKRSLERGRRVNKDQRPKINTPPGGNNKLSGDERSHDQSHDLSHDRSHDQNHKMGTTTVDKYGIYRTMC